MKKIVFAFILFFSFCLFVEAKEYELNSLIPVDEIATVHTEKFDYVDFSFSSKINEKGNGTIQFKSIHNNMVTKIPVSINILLFDKNKINIGYLTYCSDKDFSSNYSAFKLKGGESSAFAISVSSTYFDKGKSAKDVSYIAVADENKYCQIGGYTRYVGQTLQEILGEEEKVSKQNHFMKSVFDSIIHFFQSKGFQITLMILGGILLLLGLGFFLNSLYQRMYTHRTFLVFIPIADIYITIKLVFGNIIAVVYGVLLVISLVLSYFKILIPFYIILGIWGISLLLVVVKLVTKKYDLFYFEPVMDSSKYHTKEDDVLSATEESLLDEKSESNVSTGVRSEVSDIDDILKSLENPDGIDDEDLSQFH